MKQGSGVSPSDSASSACLSLHRPTHWPATGNYFRVSVVFCIACHRPGGCHFYQPAATVIAFHVGNCSRKSARKLWSKIPAIYREHAPFYTDGNQAYQVVIPQAQHQVITR